MYPCRQFGLNMRKMITRSFERLVQTTCVQHQTNIRSISTFVKCRYPKRTNDVNDDSVVVMVKMLLLRLLKLVPTAFSKMEGGKRPWHRLASSAISLVFHSSPHTVTLVKTVYLHICVEKKNASKTSNIYSLTKPLDYVIFSKHSDVSAILQKYFACVAIAQIYSKTTILKANRCQGLFSASERPWERSWRLLVVILGYDCYYIDMVLLLLLLLLLSLLLLLLLLLLLWLLF